MSGGAIRCHPPVGGVAVWRSDNLAAGLPAPPPPAPAAATPTTHQKQLLHPLRIGVTEVADHVVVRGGQVEEVETLLEGAKEDFPMPLRAVRNRITSHLALLPSEAARMEVYIELLRGGIDVKALLREQGWRLDEQGADRLLAKHAEVNDQEVARDRLLQAGLLTSAEVRIEFGWPPPRPATRRDGESSIKR